MTRHLRILALVAVTGSILVACIGSPSRIEGRQQKEFEIRSLAKGDIDSVLDIHVREARKLCRELMKKLYRRNPRELAKNPITGILRQ